MNTFTPFKNRKIMSGMKVKVYRNLHQDKFSIVDLESGYVLGHADSVTLLKAGFKVSEKSRQRVIETGQKNVHAYVIGTLVTCNTLSNGNLKQAYYNPYETDQFIDIETGEPLKEVERVQLQNRKVYYHVAG